MARPYTTTELLNARDTAESIIDLTDDDHSGTVNQDFVDKAITDGDDIIDSHLNGRVSCFPFTEDTPTVVVGISTELAIYFLYLRRFGSIIPEGIMFRYKEAMRQLKDIAKGEIIICPKEASQVSVKTLSPAPVFTAETLKGY